MVERSQIWCMFIHTHKTNPLSTPAHTHTHTHTHTIPLYIYIHNEYAHTHTHTHTHTHHVSTYRVQQFSVCMCVFVCVYECVWRGRVLR